MSDLFTTTILIATVASGIRLATPFLLASLGEALGQRSGVLNLGVDGVMLLGAFSAYYTVLKTGNLWLGICVSRLSVFRELGASWRHLWPSGASLESMWNNLGAMLRPSWSQDDSEVHTRWVWGSLAKAFFLLIW